ncbi:MAG TPA: DUF2254 family protein [Kofleriaceae bacterium]|nr:DUF2254 family protein [Kofleriaceae bacterium]
MRQSWRNQWLFPMLLLGALAGAVVSALYGIDHALNDAGLRSPIEHYLDFDSESVSNSIGVLSSIIAAVLGIIITVASIVVQLAATRYTPAVTEMFFRDRTNRTVLALYIIGCVMGFWIAFAVNTDWVPRVSLIAMLVAATLGFLLMGPYFAYVFRLLAPESVVSRIQEGAQESALGAGRYRDDPALERQGEALAQTEQLTDIAVNAISQKDKIIATACVDALRDLALAYLGGKAAQAPAWFALGRTIRSNPDFASMAEDSVAELESSRTWFEFKVLRQYQSIYTEALGTMRDINYVIAINTRHLAERALELDEREALQLSIKFFNTYLRATLNQGDVRTAYTILNQYRMMAEAVLRSGDSATALAIANHIKYYGHVSYQKRLAFVTETVAYDLGALCEVAHDLGAAVEDQLLAAFLEADPKTSEGEVQEASLRGVRKAQLKLATYYLASGSEELARRVWEDMRDESAERLHSIRDELLAVQAKDFWEISDRGGNFDYLPPERKEMLRIFFGWFRDVSGELKAVSLDSPSAGRPLRPTGEQKGSS